MRKVIVNSTPLIALSKINQLELLKKMYGEIYIPEAVYREVTRKNDIVKKQIQNNDWIHVEHIKNFERKRMYSAKLHEGEIEVMILAEEYGNEHIVESMSAHGIYFSEELKKKIKKFSQE